MKELLRRAVGGDIAPQELRRRIRGDRGAEMRRRRGIVGLSLVGIASMGVVALYQTGVLRHLPGPPSRRPHFDSERVNGSDEAFGHGMPDGPVALAAHAANLAIAAAGAPERYRTRPWLPLLAALLSGAQAAVAARALLHRMPKEGRAWCAYCIADALTHVGTFALTLPEAARAGAALIRPAGEPPDDFRRRGML